MWCCAGCFASSWRRCEASSVSYRWAGEALGFLLVSRYSQQLHVAWLAVCLFMGPFPTRHTCNSSLSCVHMAIRQQMTLKGIGKLAFLLPKFFFCNVCFRLKESIGCIWSFSVSCDIQEIYSYARWLEHIFHSEVKWEQFGTCLWCLFQVTLCNLSLPAIVQVFGAVRSALLATSAGCFD